MSVEIKKELCSACEACVSVCPFGAIEIVDGAAQVNERCTLCGSCEYVCPSDALSIEKKVAVAEKGYGGIWVFAEQRLGKIAGVAFELLGRRPPAGGKA